MKYLANIRLLVLATLFGSPSAALAVPAHHVCVPAAIGVPTRPGAPKWLDWTGTTAPADTALDDPRWLGATGQSYELGGARAPLHARALWSNVAGKDYLYLSFIVDLEGLTGAGAATPRDLFLGFRRATPFTNNTSDPTDDEYGYIFQFHLTTGAANGLVTPTRCSSFTQCDEESGTGKDFWRVFVDRNENGTCTSGSDTVAGARFRSFAGSLNWMTNTSPAGQDAVRFWKLDANQPPLLQNRWAVQLRLPIAPASGQSIDSGIDPNATFWYQGAADIPGDHYAYLGAWPREVTAPVCPAQSAQDFLIHPQLGAASAECPGCSPDNYSRLSRFAGTTRPDGCDSGITIGPANIGAMFNAAVGTNFANVTPTTLFKALKPDGTPGTNTVIAQAENTGSTPISARLMARFRLASWGSAPIGTTDNGKWKDMRGAENGVCDEGSLPGCAPVTIQPNGRSAITFKWTIGDDPTLGASEYCKFGLTPPSGTCSDCSCAGQANCDNSTDQGTKASNGPCVSKHYQHQCMLVELSAPNGGVNFVQQSAWNNMNFDQMSVVEREALIDVRELPIGKGQTHQDIYLIGMGRNMPLTLPGGKGDGAQFIRERALVHAEAVAEAYVKDSGAKPDLPQSFNERVQRIFRAFELMPGKEQGRIRNILSFATSTGMTAAQMTESIVTVLGSVEAARIVPTLEIYPFYQPSGKGAAYLPMTAFTVFLSHEGDMFGMNWTIQGAQQVGKNIFHLKIPVGSTQRIVVRAEAMEQALFSGEPDDPECAGGCMSSECGVAGQLGNALPGLLAGLFAARRRRKRWLFRAPL